MELVVSYLVGLLLTRKEKQLCAKQFFFLCLPRFLSHPQVTPANAPPALLEPVRRFGIGANFEPEKLGQARIPAAAR
jgi:hypothetical protein